MKEGYAPITAVDGSLLYRENDGICMKMFVMERKYLSYEAV